MSRDYIRELGTIKDYNKRIAEHNLLAAVNSVNNIVEELKDYVNSSINIDGNAYRLAKTERKLRTASRQLQIAVDDVDATSKGQFPVEYDKIQKICGRDPRDWVFDFVNIGNCHDCPLHAHIRGNKNKPCGAEECIVKQLCGMIGYHQNG